MKLLTANKLALTEVSLKGFCRRQRGRVYRFVTSFVVHTAKIINNGLRNEKANIGAWTINLTPNVRAFNQPRGSETRHFRVI